MSASTESAIASLASSALIEITEISQALREYIHENDSSGSVVCVARGMLARVQCLSESVSLILLLDEIDSPEEEQRRLFKLIECRAPGEAAA